MVRIIQDYRLIDTDPIPDSLRYIVLRDGKGRCALCGATKNERVLDVDHIIPRSLGGKTEYSNLQVLCSKCNRSKGNKDKTDFRVNLIERDDDCLFCKVQDSDVVLAANELAFVIKDKYPVTKDHMLVIPRRHVVDYFDATNIELEAIHDLMRVMKLRISEEDKQVTGFNIGVNNGHSAGQSIFHLHFHLIPRRKGDMENPRGGVRGVVPQNMSY